MASLLAMCESSIDGSIKQIMREVRSDKKFHFGDRTTRRQRFLSHLASSLRSKYPYFNVVIIRQGQTHSVNADSVMRKVQGPAPGSTDYFGFSSPDYCVYICRRGSFTNFGYGGPVDLKWCGNIEKVRNWGPRNQTLMSR